MNTTRLILSQTDPICVLNTGFDCMINTLVQFCSTCSETLPTQPSVRYARFQQWICSSGSTGEHNLSKKAARWNFQFDIGKQRRNTLFRFMNTFRGEHAGPFSCRFCVLDLLLSNSFPEYSN